jgi:hypothetical protein
MGLVGNYSDRIHHALQFANRLSNRTCAGVSPKTEWPSLNKVAQRTLTSEMATRAMAFGEPVVPLYEPLRW